MKKLGFTLIELSIVLVIIGLVAGSILVGSELINAARIRAQISQIQEMTSAVNTFRLKYDSLPGDISSQKASAFGMTPRSGLPRHGDENRLLQSCVDANRSDTNFGCELAMFWNDLGFAKLIAGEYPLNVDQPFGGIQISRDQIERYFPRAKIGGESFVAIYSDDDRDGGSIITVDCPGPFCFSVSPIALTNALGQYSVASGAFTPPQAFSIDQKMDDGRPLTGTIQTSSKIGLGFLLRLNGDGYAFIPDKGCFAENSLLTGYVYYKSAQAGEVEYALSGDNSTKQVCLMSFSYR